MTVSASVKPARRRFLLGAGALALPAFVAPLQSAYATATPDATVRATTEQVLALIANTPDAQRLQDMVEDRIVAYFDFRRLTQLAAGRVWSRATPPQQARMAAS